MFVYKGKTYYYNTYTFCTHLKKLYTIKEQKNIKLVVNPYLLEIATIQQNITIDQDRRLGILVANSEDRLILALKDKFKPSPTEAFNTLLKTRYLLDDCYVH